jgi:type I restriction-modification system DNA methylase subunit
MLEPYEGRVYDPCCGSAGMFVQSEHFVQAHGGQKTDISIFGQESNPTTWRLAHMSLAIRSIEANLGAQPADSFLRSVLTGGGNGESMLADGVGDPNFDSALGRIVYAFRQWRGEPAPAWWNDAKHGTWACRDIAGFCKAESIEGIGKHCFVLTPGRYVGAEEQEDDGEPFAQKYPRLLAELEQSLGEGERLMAVVRERLKCVGDAG